MNDVGVQNKHKQSNQSRSAFSTLESVIRQAESLFPTERLSLWQHLARAASAGSCNRGEEESLAARFTEKLPFIVGMILDNLIRAFALEGSNMLFERHANPLRDLIAD